MDFSYRFLEKQDQMIKTYAKKLGISKALLAKIKFQGGKITVNGQEENVLYRLHHGDELVITIPDEQEHETVLCDETPIDIVYEDEHLLVVNKPAQVASIPSQYHPNGTMVNRVKAYYKRQHYRNQVIHVVTRLDRDTTGLMLFAKHGFCHALLDQQLRQKQIQKTYQALVTGEVIKLSPHGYLSGNIARDLSSLLKRQVVPSTEGRTALTEYWKEDFGQKQALLNIRLHTGRTHQIRVHFAHENCPLVGDDLYGGAMDEGMERQALHCRQLQLVHPFTKEKLTLNQPLPRDMKEVLARWQKED